MDAFTLHDPTHARKVAHLMWHILDEERRQAGPHCFHLALEGVASEDRFIGGVRGAIVPTRLVRIFVRYPMAGPFYAVGVLCGDTE